ncbi:PREDICTED: uncharacterized protein LOC109220834 [Nicotiana attenuata]|uniref:uncharacterized protein LOC109220834 n=1 Tax=Nicotiana attenuata TaxID=49451 RepID=UPI000904C157|nr:PREDICTED: uncharacterized protein LOC109220834 [Nicotiana attenuata]
MALIWLKLKRLKDEVKSLNKAMASYEQRLTQIRQSLECVQAALVTDPFNQMLIEREKQHMSDLEKWSTIEERILSQKSRATGIDYGDSNSEYFYAQLKIRASKNNITSVYNDLGMKITDLKAVGKEFTEFFTQLMGNANGLMPRPNTKIDEAIRDMPKDKAPGLDGRMMPAWNCTAITLIPKIRAPSKVKNYRPIACCTTLYKVVAKILTRRIKKFLRCMLTDLGLPQKFIHWVMECVSTVSYSFMLNGCLTKPFQARRGIRQGDPMSPYLFVIAMEEDKTSATKMQETFRRFSVVSGL